jgi:hypothetical protein
MEWEGSMPTEIRITTDILYRGALLFALLDAVYVPMLVWRVKEEMFRRLKWPLVISAALIWNGIWWWAIGNYWDAIYSYVFPAWAQTWVPRIALIVAGIVALGLWSLALRLKWNVIVTYCLSGGVIGSLTHIWAVHLGIVTRPPMLQGASPWAAIIIAFFEFIFYWCTILVSASLMDWLYGKGTQSGKLAGVLRHHGSV